MKDIKITELLPPKKHDSLDEYEINRETRGAYTPEDLFRMLRILENQIKELKELKND